MGIVTAPDTVMYGTYTLMDNDSNKVMAFSVVQVSEVTSLMPWRRKVSSAA